MRLISEDSKFKDEIEFTMNGLLSYQIGNSTKRNRPTLCILRCWWSERKEGGALLSKPLLDARLQRGLGHGLEVLGLVSVDVVPRPDEDGGAVVGGTVVGDGDVEGVGPVGVAPSVHVGPLHEHVRLGFRV